MGVAVNKTESHDGKSETANTRISLSVSGQRRDDTRTPCEHLKALHAITCFVEFRRRLPLLPRPLPGKNHLEKHG